jgi:hypothetical protein
MNQYFYIVMILLIVLSMSALSGCELKEEVVDSPTITQPDDESLLEREDMAEEQVDEK